MDNRPFKILVDYNGEKVIAEVESSYGEVEMIFKAKFPNGELKTFFYFEDEDDEHTEELDESQWVEENWGNSELANNVGAQVDKWLVRPDLYIAPFELLVNDRKIIAEPVIENKGIYFKIYETGKFIFILNTNEDGSWVADNEEEDSVGEIHPLDQDFAQNIGDAIEDYQS